MKHPAYTRMVCESLHALGEHASMVAMKKHMESTWELPAGFEKHLNATVHMMVKKHQLAHQAGHMGTFRLSKPMAEKEAKRLHRAKAHEMKMAEKQAAAMKKTKKPATAAKKAPMKRKAAKMAGPAKKAKKAAPKKA